MDQRDTKQKILDAAERCFADHGYHCSSLRTLTREAGVNLAAVNYHFGSKEELLKAVIERRLIPLNALRIKRLQSVRDEARRQGRRPLPRDVLFAFIEPTFAFKESGPGAREFIAIIGRTFSEPDDTVRRIFMQLIEPFFHLFSELLAESVPDLPAAVFLQRMQFIIGAMSHTLLMNSGPYLCRTVEQTAPVVSELICMFLDFATAGLEADVS
jgi:AcrR family transcriptional regulator